MNIFKYTDNNKPDIELSVQNPVLFIKNDRVFLYVERNVKRSPKRPVYKYFLKFYIIAYIKIIPSGVRIQNNLKVYINYLMDTIILLLNSDIHISYYDFKNIKSLNWYMLYYCKNYENIFYKKLLKYDDIHVSIDNNITEEIYIDIKILSDFMKCVNHSPYGLHNTKKYISNILKKYNDISFLRSFIILIDWEATSKDQKLSESFIREFQDYVYWLLIIQHQVLSESFIREFIGKNDDDDDDIFDCLSGSNDIWTYISKYQELSESFIREFPAHVHWKGISRYQVLSESFIREFQNHVYWKNISEHQVLSESFICEFQDKLDWSCISKYQVLSESFICEFQHLVHWSHISKFQVLSESFIREFKKYMNITLIIIYQNISDSFINEFNNEIDWLSVSSQELSKSFVKKYEKYLCLFLVYNKNNYIKNDYLYMKNYFSSELESETSEYSYLTN